MTVPPTSCPRRQTTTSAWCSLVLGILWIASAFAGSAGNPSAPGGVDGPGDHAGSGEPARRDAPAPDRPGASPDSGAGGSAGGSPGATQVSIRDGQWWLNGRLTHPGSPAAGLLMNVRMVNATFEDCQRPGFDPGANTDRFLARLPDYAAQGVQAFTLCLQGGMPGYEGAVNSAFRPDGTLREDYLGRVRRVLDACDRLGRVVILGCYYQRQDQVLRDADAVRTGVVEVARWLRSTGFRNVLLEIANEFDHAGFDHPLLRTPAGQVELMALARREMPGLLVSTSGQGHGGIPEPVAQAASFLLVHFNGTRVGDIPGRIEALKPFRKPIVCNEDDKVGEEAARAAEACVAAGASWGLMLKEVNQFLPFRFDGAADDPIAYAALRRLTQPGGGEGASRTAGR